MALPVVCESYNTPSSCEKRNKCTDLHICKKFVCGNCSVKRCPLSLSHDIFSQQPLKVLLARKVDVGRSSEEILQDLRECLSEESASEEEEQEVDDDYDDDDNDDAGCTDTLNADDKSEPNQLLTCKHYNTEKECKFGDKCRNMHLCYHYLIQKCKYRNECRRSHNIRDPQPMRILQNFGINPRQPAEQILREIRSRLSTVERKTRGQSKSESSKGATGGASIPHLARTRFESSSSGIEKRTSSSVVESESHTGEYEELCVHHLLGKCKFEKSCRNLHPQNKRPYMWMLHELPQNLGGAKDWVEFDDQCVEDIEACFCDPSKSECYTKTDKNISYKINFSDMSYIMRYATMERVGQVKRLGTRSSIGSSERHLFLTEWLWYWKDDKGNWIEYGFNDKRQKVHGCITSRELEKEFEQNPESSIINHMTGNDYEINFKKMSQKNKKTGQRDPIIRRPARFDAETKHAGVLNEPSEMLSKLILD